MFIISIPTVRADSFYPSGDVRYCELVTAVGLAIGDLPASGVNNVEYEAANVSGEFGSWITSHTIHDVANVYAGSLRRYPQVLGSISAPPGTRVDIGMWWLNYSGHSIDTGTSYLYLGAGGTGLESVLDIPYVSGSLGYLHNGVVKNRNGNRVEIPLMGNLPNTSISGAPAGKVIASGVIKKPLQITNIKAECVFDPRGHVIMSKYIKLRNTSQFTQNNIRIASNNQTANMPPQQENVTRIDEDLGYIYSNAVNGSFVAVYNPSINTACGTSGGVKGDDTDPGSHIFFVSRNDSSNRSWFGLQTDIAAVPRGDFFCIKQIPYTENVGGFSCVLPEKINLTALSDKKELHPGASSLITIKIENVGISKRSDVLIVSFPEIFDRYLSIVGGEKEINNGIVSVVYPVPDVLTNKTCEIQQNISVNAVIPYDLPENLVVKVTYGTETSTIEYKVIKNLAITSVLDIANYCSNSGTFPVNVKIVIGGNVMIRSLSVKHVFDMPSVNFCNLQNVPQDSDVQIAISPLQNMQLIFISEDGAARPIIEKQYFTVSEFELGTIKILGDIYPGEISIPLEVSMSSFTQKVEIVSTVCAGDTNICHESIFTKTCGTNIQCNGNSNETDQLNNIVNQPIQYPQSVITEVVGTIISRDIISQVLSVWNIESNAIILPASLRGKLAVTGNDITWMGYLLCLAFIMLSIALVFTAKSVFKSYVKFRPRNCENKYS